MENNTALSIRVSSGELPQGTHQPDNAPQSETRSNPHCGSALPIQERRITQEQGQADGIDPAHALSIYNNLYERAEEMLVRFENELTEGYYGLAHALITVIDKDRQVALKRKVAERELRYQSSLEVRLIKAHSIFQAKEDYDRFYERAEAFLVRYENELTEVHGDEARELIMAIDRHRRIALEKRVADKDLRYQSTLEVRFRKAAAALYHEFYQCAEDALVSYESEPTQVHYKTASLLIMGLQEHRNVALKSRIEDYRLKRLLPLRVRLNNLEVLGATIRNSLNSQDVEHQNVGIDFFRFLFEFTQTHFFEPINLFDLNRVAQILLKSANINAQSVAIQYYLTVTQEEDFRVLYRLHATLILLFSGNQDAEAAGITACDGFIKEDENLRAHFYTEQGELYMDNRTPRSLGLDLCAFAATDCVYPVLVRQQIIRALSRMEYSECIQLAQNLAVYYDKRLVYVSDNLDEMKQIHEDASSVLLGTILIDSPIYKNALYTKFNLNEGLVNKQGHLAAYGIHARAMELDRQEVDFTYGVEEGSAQRFRIIPEGLFKAPALPVLSAEQLAITHGDLLNLVKRFFEEGNLSDEKHQEIKNLLVANGISVRRLERKICSTTIQSWFDITTSGASLSFMQKIARLCVDFLNNQDSSEDPDGLSVQASQTFQLLRQLVSCAGGQEQGMRAFYDYVKQVQAGEGLSHIHELAIEDLPQKRFIESLENWREVRILAHVETMINGHEGVDTFMEAVTGKTGIAESIQGTSHEALYLRNAIGGVLGVRREEGLTFDPHAYIVCRPLLEKSKQELLDIFKTHFSKEFTIKSLSEELASSLSEDLASFPADVSRDLGPTNTNARMRYEGLLQGFFTPDEIMEGEDVGFFKGSFDDEVLFVWTQIDEVTPKGAERIMEKLGWIEALREE